MKKAILFLLILWTTICCAGTVEDIKRFYSDYIGCSIEGKTEDIISLKNTNLSPACREKLARVTAITNCDPILRAQDVNSDMLESLYVEDLGKDWFLVSYYWNKSQKSSMTVIPIKAVRNEGKMLIVYITPSWNHNLSGDDSIRKIDKEIIRHDTAQAFLKSFYSQYLSTYCDMEGNVSGRLESLRYNYCTKRAINDYKLKHDEYQVDGLIEYDALIDNFDFDGNWYNSLIIDREDERTYRVNYRDWSQRSIEVSIIKCKGCYYIDHICPSPVSH